MWFDFCQRQAVELGICKRLGTGMGARGKCKSGHRVNGSAAKGTAGAEYMYSVRGIPGACTKVALRDQQSCWRPIVGMCTGRHVWLLFFYKSKLLGNFGWVDKITTGVLSLSNRHECLVIWCYFYFR
jgi:hypothetical protein